MKLFVLGATGKTGKLVVEQALAKGHEVTAFVRSPEKMASRHERLTVRKGDPTRADEIAAALPGHDAVISVIGAPNLGPTTIHADCATATVQAMKRAGVSRVLVLSSSFMFDELPWFARVIRRLVFRNIERDHAAMERAFVESGLDWTLVRPPRLLPGAATEKYEVTDDRPAPKLSVRFADVAHFMVTEAEKREHARKAVGMARA
jgi:putative NADH-flavin reductase